MEEIELFSDAYFMREALREAEKAKDKDEVPIGCVIVLNNRVIARGHNLTETLNDVTAHAEMQSITAAENYLGAKYLNDCTIFITLEPCLMCAGALRWAQIGRIVFGAQDLKYGFGKFIENITHPKTTVTGGVMELECSTLITEFFKRKRSK
jgi:tRNA(adenine34) deaminase